MFRNYLKIAFRNIRKQPFYTFIFVSGLALGLTAFLFLNQYTAYERSYDAFHPQVENLYRLTTDQVINGELATRDAMSHAPAGELMLRELPEVIGYSTSYKTERLVFRKGQQPIEELETLAADEHFLDIFSHTILAGDPATMLSEPLQIVLTESQAKKYFGTTDPMGKTLEELDQFHESFTVTGIIADVPGNTHYHFDMLVSLASYLGDMDDDSWGGNNYYTYLLLDEQAKLENMESKLTALAKQYMGEDGEFVFNLQPVLDIHLHSDFTFEPQAHGSAKAVRFLGIISVFILLIAWVNYVNLSTAKAIERAKEVGLRKVVGADRKQLIGQFFLESFLVNLFGALLAIGLAVMIAPLFNELVGKDVISGVVTNAGFMSKLGLFFVLGTLATGFYPAIVLSSFLPITALRGSFGRTQKGIFLRQFLVVVQFAASLLLIASTIIIYKQVSYMSNLKMGMNTEQVLGFAKPDPGELSYEAHLSKMRTFEAAVLAQPGITAIGGIQNMPGGNSFDINSTSGGIRIAGREEVIASTVYLTGTDDQYFDVLEVNMLAGRNFDRSIAADSSGFIVNEAFVELMNLSSPEEITGEFLQLSRDVDATRYPVVGVAQNFNRSSLKEQVEPTIFYYDEAPWRWIVKLDGQKVSSNVAHIQKTFQSMFPEAPFAYSFLDDRFAKIYAEDQRFGQIFLYFSGLAIIVAFMGLFGLSSFMALQRTKEVGIRKVLGASVSQIIILFFKDFLRLIVIAVAIGLPLTYFSMNGWLTGYAHRIDFPWWALSLGVLAIGILAFFTVSFQTWRVALMNPSETIRVD